MKPSFSIMFRYLSLLLISGLAGCGSKAQLRGVSISPATADAKNYPSGQVQFTATGSFDGQPSQPLKSPQITWCTGTANGACAGNIVQGAAVDENGLAQCNPSFTGTANIMAGTYTPATMPDGGAQLKIFGVAQLTCP
jgi:hypothetical protein